MLSDEYTSLQKSFDEFSKITADLLKKAHEAKNEAVEQRLQEVWFRLQQGPIRTLVLGVSSAGKSTLINAAVGELVSPEGINATSPVPVWIYSDDAEKIDKIWRSGNIYREQNKKVQNKKIVISLYEYLIYFCYTPNDISVKDRRLKYEPFEAIKIRTANKVLGDPCFTLIDTPGINANENEDTLRTIRTADRGFEMLVFVADNANLHETEVNFIQNLMQNKDNCFLKDSLFVVHNVKDPMNGIGENDSFNTSVFSVFGQNMNQEHIHHINLLEARFDAIDEPYPYLKCFPNGTIEKEFEEYKNRDNFEKENFAIHKALYTDDKCPAFLELKKMLSALNARAKELCKSPDSILSPIRHELLRCMKELQADELECNKRKNVLVPNEMQEELENIITQQEQLKNKQLAATACIETMKQNYSTIEAQLQQVRNKSIAALNKIANDANIDEIRYNIFLNTPETVNIESAASKEMTNILSQNVWNEKFVVATIDRFQEYIVNVLGNLKNQVLDDHREFCKVLQTKKSEYLTSAKEIGISDTDANIIKGDLSVSTIPNVVSNAFGFCISDEFMLQLENIQKTFHMYCIKKNKALTDGGMLKKWWEKTGLPYECYNHIFSEFFLSTIKSYIKYYTESSNAYCVYYDRASSLQNKFILLMRSYAQKLNAEMNVNQEKISDYKNKIVAYKAKVIGDEKDRILKYYTEFNNKIMIKENLYV